MTQRSPQKVTAQWTLAGRLCAALSVLQMILFCILVITSSPAEAYVNFWGLILGFSITGVTAAVCMARVQRRAKHHRH